MRWMKREPAGKDQSLAILRKPLARRRRGQSLIMLTLGIFVLFGAMALAVDVGFAFYLKKYAQSAADAAAMAGGIDALTRMGGGAASCGGNVVCQPPTACPTPVPNPPQNPSDEACLYAQQNGFTTGGANGAQSVLVSAGLPPPPDSPGVNNISYWISVKTQQISPIWFGSVQPTGTQPHEGPRHEAFMPTWPLAFWLSKPLGSSARATAGITPSQDCIWVMDPAAASALTLSGTPSLVAKCGVFVNSNNVLALNGNGTPTLKATGINIVGNYTFHGTLSPNPPNTGQPTRSDPLAYLHPPSTVGMTVQSSSLLTISGWSVVTLQPGIYQGGIYVKNGTAIFSPGVYVIEGGGLSTQSANSTIQGAGAMIYNTCSTPGSCGVGSNYAPFGVYASSTVTLTAPTTGTYSGILIMEDRSIPLHTYSDNFGGGSTASYNGTIYALNSAVTMYGNSSLSAYSNIVVDTLSMVGTTDINDDYTSLPGGNPIKAIALVE